MNIKIEYKYIQSNIFIVSAAYLFKSLQKKSFSLRVACDYFLFHLAGG